jgi:hypothetical protein
MALFLLLVATPRLENVPAFNPTLAVGLIDRLLIDHDEPVAFTQSRTAGLRLAQGRFDANHNDKPAPPNARLCWARFQD